MSRVVGIRFKAAGKVYYFDPGDLLLLPGDGAVVETARGVELGTVAVAPREVPEAEVKAPLKRVIRKAGPEDLSRRQENEEKARRAFSVAQQKIEEHKLPMKLADVEFTLDGAKIIFYFTAENRVDFRDLVKDLASTFRTRIELRQIGVRDEAKLLGGLGPCGRQLCCQAFLGDFVPVSIRMAKEQNLSLNPTKISGICGRLMCCLNYESERYREAKRAEKERAAVQAAQAPPMSEEPAAALPAAPAAATPTPARMAEPAPPGAEREREGGGRRKRHHRRPAQASPPAGPPSGAPAGERGEHHPRRRGPRRGPGAGGPGDSGGSGNQGGSPPA